MRACLLRLGEYWRAFLGGVRSGLAVEPVDYSPEGQIARLRSKLSTEEDR